MKHTTDKAAVNRLIQACREKGISRVVLSPGSRNAPFIIGFNRDEAFTCYALGDERVAAFFALGMAQQLREPVILACTSGSAALNYAPAVAEAFYQKVPLLILTADRPEEWTDQGDGQTIRQTNIFNNYILGSYTLPQETEHPDRLWQASRLAAEAIDRTMLHGGGPVHINCPFRESLYQVTEQPNEADRTIQTVSMEQRLASADLDRLAKTWNTSDRKLIVAGMMVPNEKLESLLQKLARDASVVVLTETTSNLNGPRFFPCIDKVVDPLMHPSNDPEEMDAFRPDLLITIGGPVVSKKVKSFLRKHKATTHWQVNADELHLDTYQSLTHNIPMDAEAFFSSIIPLVRSRSSNYYKVWKTRDEQSETLHDQFLETVPYSDLQVFQHLLRALPTDSQLQLGNSTPVRYAQLFRERTDLTHYANRGTSGIDGSTSTAAGAAQVNQVPTTIITGDVAFFYDSNALWNPYLSANLRIVLINNGGGGIFRIIPGPDTTSELEDYFETGHNLNAAGIAQSFGIPYSSCRSIEDLEAILLQFFTFDTGKPALLEIHTPGDENGQVLRDYFKLLHAGVKA